VGQCADLLLSAKSNGILLSTPSYNNSEVLSAGNGALRSCLARTKLALTSIPYFGSGRFEWRKAK